MSEPFDPYHKWLGIPPTEQPANHYRLLGIQLLEADPDVIQGAADRQMMHLRTFQTGKNGLIAQRIATEVAAARICLLDAERKALYDEELRRSLANKPDGREASAASVFPEIRTAVDPKGRRRTPVSADKKTSSPTRISLVAAIVGGAIGLMIAAAVVGRLVSDPSSVGAKSRSTTPVADVASAGTMAAAAAGTPAADDAGQAMPVVKAEPTVDAALEEPPAKTKGKRSGPVAKVPPAKTSEPKAAKAKSTAEPPQTKSAKATAADNDDPIANELRKAKESYRSSIAVARGALLAAFREEQEKLSASAKTSADEKLRRQEALQQERILFLTESKLPKSAALLVAASDYRTSTSAAKVKCERAFEAAKDAYAKRGNASGASSVSAEKDTFLAVPGRTSGPLAPLMNGVDLAGWKVLGNPTDAWRVANGAIECISPRAVSMLATERRDLKDFYLRLETMLVDGRAGGISLRLTTRGMEEASYRVLIPSANQMDRGSIMGELQFAPNFAAGGNAAKVLQKPSAASSIAPNDWFTVEIIAVGNEILVFINDNQVIDFRDAEDRLPSGGIGILCRANAKVRLRNMEMKEIQNAK